MANHFTVQESRTGDATSIVCSGELDIATAPNVEKAVDNVFSSDPPSALALDWSGLTFMDSTGIRLLLRIVKRAAAGGIELTWKLSDAAQRALDAVGIHDDLLEQLSEETGPEESSA